MKRIECILPLALSASSVPKVDSVRPKQPHYRPVSTMSIKEYKPKAGYPTAPYQCKNISAKEAFHFNLQHNVSVRSPKTPSQVLRPTSYGKWVGGPMSLKGGNFSFQARTDQNQPRMDKYGTYLDFNASQGAPKHCPTLDSLTQCFARAHFRSPPGASGSLR